MKTTETTEAPSPATSLSGSHLRTYQAIFQHPITCNLGWQDVHALFRQLGEIHEEANGKLKVTRNGQTLVLHPPRTKDVSDKDEVMSLRHFLERSEALPHVVEDAETQWLLVIDHHEARIFQSPIRGSVPEHILPHEPEDFFRHARNSESFSRGKEKPDPNSFFEPVAQALRGAGKILIFGSGTGMSSEMEQFVAWVQSHHPEIAQRIIGWLAVDESHLTNAQLLAKAREFHANSQVSGS
ncbi:MAG TPA: hypothetical protein VF614_10020 [Chthoniobacteraceae bacterium]|jgi:hypothetical protein